MIKAKIIVVLICSTISYVHTIAQTAKVETPRKLYIPSNSNAIKELNIGDEVPDITFEDVLNYPVRKAKLSAFTAKLTILDFWSTSCGSCVALLPHMQSLKDQYNGKLQIILVNGKSSLFHDNESKIQGALKKLHQSTGTAIKLPIVLNNETLDNYFPWETIPHEVWIDSKRTVVAITGAMEVTEGNINALLEGKKINMRTKKDISINLQKQTLSDLVYGTNQSVNRPEYSSILLRGYVDGLRGQGVRYADSPFTGLYTGWFITNQPLFRIYESAYRDVFKYPANQVVVEVSDPSRFTWAYKPDTSMYSNTYSYDISVSPTKFDELLTYVQGDLERTFKVRVYPGTRKIKCFVIKASPQLERSYSISHDQVWETGTLTSKKHIRNYPIYEILKSLNNFSAVPLIDETGLSKNIDMDLPYDLWDTDLLLKALRQVGFDILEEQREMNVVIISNN